MTTMEDVLPRRIRAELVADGELADQTGGGSLFTESRRMAAGRARSARAGLGPLASLLSDPNVTDVLVNGPNETWVDRGEGLRRVRVELAEEEISRLARRLAAVAGRRLDDAQPWVDCQLPDGTRMHAILPPISGRGVCLSLRTFRPVAFTLADLVARRMLPESAAKLLADVVRARLAFLVTGGAGTGKTTLLATLLGRVDPTERIVVVEDAPELRASHPHVVSLAARPANAEGAGEVTTRDLVRQALRMRPDRIVVGECRGAEVVDLLSALNTGHDGGAGTIHANSPADTVSRLAALAALAGLPAAAAHAQIAAAIRCLIHLARRPSGRVVAEISVLIPDGPSGRPTVEAAWRHDGGSTPGRQRLERLLAVEAADDRSRP